MEKTLQEDLVSCMLQQALIIINNLFQDLIKLDTPPQAQIKNARSTSFSKMKPKSFAINNHRNLGDPNNIRHELQAGLSAKQMGTSNQPRTDFQVRGTSCGGGKSTGFW
ncbi:Hypothetical_protein [Hexamita inflata]|uniref:Hypothetical_protein n=1 Tax=Hexamita inflata TaxID=28002 RepID=A0AA86PRF6_9EUKA|nr:Hypothetical protein HINF_LOCUS31001 [Hexamita inflata]